MNNSEVLINIADVKMTEYIKHEHAHLASDSMCQLNSISEKLAQLDCVTALSDVTSFGLGGHLREVCDESGINALSNYSQLPLLPHVVEYLNQGYSSGGIQRNFDSYGEHISAMTPTQQSIVRDPQTSGGLLIADDENDEQSFHAVIKATGLSLETIGYLTEKNPDAKSQAMIETYE